MFNRSTVELMSEELQQAANVIAEKYGCKVEQKKGCFSTSTFEKGFKFFIPVIGVSNKTSVRDIEAFNSNCIFVGLKPEHLNKFFTDSKGNMFKIVGWNGSARKNKILLEDVNGSSFHCTPEFAKNYLK